MVMVRMRGGRGRGRLDETVVGDDTTQPVCDSSAVIVELAKCCREVVGLCCCGDWSKAGINDDVSLCGRNKQK